MLTILLLIPSLLLQSHYPLTETEKREYIIRQFTVNDGLPVNSVNDIVQDEDGYLYFSTLDGLAQFDGYRFRIINTANTPGVQTNRFSGMVNTQTGIWTINSGGSLTRKSGRFFTTYPVSSLPGSAIRILEDPGKTVWVSTTNGVARYDENMDRFVPVRDSLLTIRTWALGAGNRGELLAVNKYGLVMYQDGSAQVLLSSGDFPVSSTGVMQVQQFKEGYIWLVGEGGAFRFDSKSNSIDFSFTGDTKEIKVWNIVEKGPQEYVLAASNGFYRLKGASLKPEKLPIPVSSDRLRTNLVYEGKYGEEIWIGDDEILIDGKVIVRQTGLKAALVDNEGSLWVSTYADGVYQIRKSSFINITDREIPGLNNIYPVIQTQDGSVWAGSFGNGIYRIGRNKVTNWNRDNSDISGDITRFLYEDKDGSVYAGLFEINSLTKLENGSWRQAVSFDRLFKDSHATVEAMHRIGDELLIGTTQSLVVLKNGKVRLFDEREPQTLEKVRVIREAEDGTLYLGTNGNGLTRLMGDKLTSFSTSNGALNSNFLRDVFVQARDTLWIASENMGLNRLVFDDDYHLISISYITTRDGLISNSLHRIIEDPFENLWISSNSGIMRIPKKGLNAYADGDQLVLEMLSFDEQDGMVNREANGGVQTAGFLSADSMLWFPNQKGITIIDPAEFVPEVKLATPEPVIEYIAFGDSTLFDTERPHVTIPAFNRNLRVGFTAPNFAHPDQVRFRYKLEGVHTNWQPGNEAREAVLTNLPPGKHTFYVESQRNGEAPRQASLMIIVPYYFHETLGFYLMLLAILSGLVYAGYKYRVKSLEERERSLKKRVDEQTEELKKAAEQKSRFFTGITHELKTPLSLIAGPLDDIADNPERLSKEKLTGRIKMMQRNSQRLQRLIGQILEVSKLNANAVSLTLQPADIAGLTRQVAGQFHSRLEQQSLSINFSADKINESIYIDHQAWERIIFNLLSNAIKYSPQGGTIWVEIKDLGDRVSVTVRDEGVGIDQEEQEKVFEYLYQTNKQQRAEGTGIGLFLVKGLVEHMGGSVILNSEPGRGAAFTVILKKGHRHFGSEHRVLHDPLVPPEVGKGPEPLILADTINGSEAGRSPDSARILLVEDNQDFREYLRLVLSENYHVSIAANGKEALKLLGEVHADLIISDVMMPEMDGLEFVNTLRARQEYKCLPVIFLSAKDQDLDMEAGLSTGADVYLTKPIHSKMLLAQIAAVLRRERILRNRDSETPLREEPMLVAQVREIVYRQLGNPSLSVSMLAEALFMSRTKLYNEWKKVSDVSLNEFIKSMRLSEAKVLLTDRGFTVQEAAYAVGYPDANYFSTSFKKEFGCSPSKIKT